MDSLFDYNINEYNKTSETAYLFRKDHQIRGDIAIEMLSEVVENKQQKLLSVACSVGVIEEKIIKKLGIRVYGIDGAPDAIKQAKKRGVITTLGDVSKKLPYDNSSFDFVFAGEIIEHLMDTKKFLSEVHRVLKPDGYLVITTPNLARIDDRIKLMFGKTPRNTTPIHPYLFLHVRPFTFDSLKSSLKTCGFNNIKLKTNIIALEFFNRKIRFYSPLLAKFFPTFGATLIVRARRT